MTLPPLFSTEIVKEELKKCDDLIQGNKITITEFDKKLLKFNATMKSEIDNEEYILQVDYENYNEWPPYLDFIDPKTGIVSTKAAYPKTNDSFFHDKHPCICNPCNRKAYKEYTGLHPDDSWKLIGWKQNPKINTLTNLRSILLAIYSRINNKQFYLGRMQ